jgi:nucleotide-binding universal stress UspA family protein
MSESVILVPLDDSEHALAALPVAKVLGDVERSTLRIVYVGERKPTGTELLRQLGLEASVSDDSTITARIGEPAAEILLLAGQIRPRLIVMCMHTAAKQEKVLGSTAMTVLRTSPCPVVLVAPERSSIPWRLQHVLAPHDGTPSTSAALRPAAEIAEHAGAELLVAHVTDVRPAPAEPGSFTTPGYVDQPQHEWPAWSSEFGKRLACICPLGHLHMRIFLARGNPAAEIVRLAKEQSTDLIVLAWRGVWESPRAAIFKQVIGEARCPIMVVRA